MTNQGLTREERIRWWRDGKYGMFIHWGLYAIPAGTWKERVHERGYSEWVMYGEKIPKREYAALADQFNPQNFDALAWVDVARKAGMTYVVLTAKHHDGFSMFDSEVTDYSVVKATPWKRDPTRELADACREAGLRFGCYYSTDRDWYRPQGPGNRYKQTNTWDYPDSTHEDFNRYFKELVMPQVRELLVKYEPDLLWFDEIDLKTRDQVMELHDMIRGIKPDCIINSRIRGCTFPEEMPPPYCDYISSGDNEIYERDIDFEWENPASMNSSFAFNKHDNNWISAGDVIGQLVNIVSKGGNYLLNVGPTADGIIPQPSVNSLVGAGLWLAVNGEAIYGTSMWKQSREPDSGVYFTCHANAVYAICLDRGVGDVTLKSLGRTAAGQEVAEVKVLGSSETPEWRQADDSLVISLPDCPPHVIGSVCRITLR